MERRRTIAAPWVRASRIVVAFNNDIGELRTAHAVRRPVYRTSARFANYSGPLLQPSGGQVGGMGLCRSIGIGISSRWPPLPQPPGGQVGGIGLWAARLPVSKVNNAAIAAALTRLFMILFLSGPVWLGLLWAALATVGRASRRNRALLINGDGDQQQVATAAAAAGRAGRRDRILSSETAGQPSEQCGNRRGFDEVIHDFSFLVLCGWALLGAALATVGRASRR